MCISNRHKSLCVCVFSCRFVPSFVSILHSNLFSPQTNRWRAAICKTEQGGSTEQERRVDEEREMGEAEDKKKRNRRKKQGSRRTEQGKEMERENKIVEFYSSNSPLHERVPQGFQLGGCRLLFAPAVYKLTFEISLL